jgi:hypothetical protein
MVGGYLTIGTSTPWGLLSVNANGLAAGTPQFVVGSSTATNFIVANNGNVGIGSTTPYTKLGVVNSTNELIFNDNGYGMNGSANYLTVKAGSGVNGQAGVNLRIDSTNLWQLVTDNNASSQNAFFIQNSNSSSNRYFTVTGAGLVGISTTTPQYLLNLVNANTPQLSLGVGAGIAQWTFRNAGGNFYLSTTTVAGTATTSIAALEISNSGFGTTTVRGLNISGQATSM